MYPVLKKIHLFDLFVAKTATYRILLPQTIGIPSLNSLTGLGRTAHGIAKDKGSAMSHFPVKLERPKGAMALLVSEPEVAVIFVHGFLGNPRSTWIDFQNLIDDLDDQRSIWSKCDLFFYHYRSKEQIAPLAEDLYTFLKGDYQRHLYESVLPSSLKVSSRAGRRAPRYKNLVFVGHSAGAVIIRDVILQNVKGLEISGKVSSWQPLNVRSDDLEISPNLDCLRLRTSGFWEPAYLESLRAYVTSTKC